VDEVAEPVNLDAPLNLAYAVALRYRRYSLS
jgi:hypothetical protein